MIRIIFFLFVFLSFNNCSLETKKLTLKRENINKDKNPSELKFDYSLTFEKFKKNVIKYGKLSDYPKLDE